jgi:hypothetical protein
MKTYTSYRSLLLTGRAVKRERNYLVVSSAGDNPQTHRLTCASKVEAKRLRAAIATDLRQARSDGGYNEILMRILGEIRSAWPQQAALEHVHSCEVPGGCKVGEGGMASCGFDWKQHQLTIDCACGPELDQTDASSKTHFVVHKDMKGRVRIYV